ncbi:hypothetical protein BH23GEM9_BH23GEM9_25730 [soil metagenome]
MKSIDSLAVISLVALIFAGCPGQRDAASRDGADSSAPDSDTTLPTDAVCLEGEHFVADGTASIGGTPGASGTRDSDDARTAASPDSREVTGLRWQAHDGCERFVIDISHGAAAANVTAQVLRDDGVVRITLRDIERAAQEATDASFNGQLAKGAYVVRSPDGPFVFVDLHLAAPAEAHVALLQDPARVLVDLRPGGRPLPSPPVTTQRVVVLGPRHGTASYPLKITGYSRTFESNVVARLEQNGANVTEQFTTATGWVDAWGYFTITIRTGPQGPINLHVGEYSARDGTWEGARLNLDMR